MVYVCVNLVSVKDVEIIRQTVYGADSGSDGGGPLICVGPLQLCTLSHCPN